MSQGQPDKREPLTDPQRVALNAVIDHIQDHGYPPTVQEIADACGYASKSTAQELLKHLQRKGYLIVHGSPRAIQVVE